MMAKSKKMAKYKRFAPPKGEAKVLIFDIETAPIRAQVWGLWEQNVGLNQIELDWHVMSWSAKWRNAPEKEVMYMDQRNAPVVEDDREILKEIWSLLDEADVVITQNGKRFDQRKLNAKFVEHRMGPPSSFKHIDTKIVAQKHFDFPSYKLEYMTNKFCKKYKKLKHKKFPGHEMWTECLKGNVEAWKEMEVYNKHDVLSLEELYFILIPWDSSINLNLFTDGDEHICHCGSTDSIRNGFYYTAVGQYQRYKCKSCGAETRGRQDLFSKEKKKSLRIGTVR
jgi:DNA polymerase elongation subunit (family B)